MATPEEQLEITLNNLEEKTGKTLEHVSLRRARQFAVVQPSTKRCVDVGINLKGVDPEGRLEASGSFNTMVSHRVRVGDAAEVDDELVGRLQGAYDAAG